MSSRRLIWRWNFRMLKGERFQLSIIAGLIAVAVATGIAGVLAAYNLAPPPEQTYGHGAARASVVGESAAQRAAFEERFDSVGVIQSASIEVAGSIERLDVRAQSPEDVTAAPLVALTAGRWPEPEEVALTGEVAAFFDAGVGADIDLANERFRVVGIVENPTDLRDEFVLLDSLDGLGIDPAQVTTSFLIEASVSDIDAASVGALGTEDRGEGIPDTRVIAALGVTVIFVVAMLQVALLAGAGFGVLSRRRTRQYGLLAAFGATPRQVQEAAATTGFIVGATGSIIGLVVAVVCVATAIPGMEELAGHRIDLALPWWGIVPGVLLGIGAASAAAWWPSRAPSRQPVTELLAARRPTARPVRRSSAIGAVLAVLGAAGLVFGVNRHVMPLAVLGAVASLIGVLLLAPAVVRILGRLAAYLPLVARIGGRAMARNQGRSAAVVAAITVALAIAVGVAAATAAIDRRDSEQSGNTPEEVGIAWLDIADGVDFVVPADVDAETTRQAAETIGRASSDLLVVPIEVAIPADAEPVPAQFARSGTAPGVLPEMVLTPTAPGGSDDVFGFGEFDGEGAEIVFAGHQLWVATPQMLDVWGLDPVRADESVVLAPWDEAFLLGERDEPVEDRTEFRVERRLPAFDSVAPTFITPAAVAAKGLETATIGWLVVGDEGFSDADRNDLRESTDGVVLTEFRDPPTSTSGIRTVAALVAAAVALVVLFGAVTLAKMESRGEMTLLASIGATERTRRKVHAAGATLLAAAGAMLAIPLGLLVQAVMVANQDSSFTAVVPWTQLIIVGILFPLAGGAMSLVGKEALPVDRPERRTSGS